MQKTKKTIFFDLDGTLIDSSIGILDSFKVILKQKNIRPKVKLNSKIIGEPLTETLGKISGSSDKNLIKKLSESFKNQYDTVGFKKTKLYENVREILSILVLKEISLFIATNKRIVPTNKILEFFDLKKFFKGIYSRDFFMPVLDSKDKVLSEIVKIHNIDNKYTFYIGDRVEDALAAEKNNIKFICASWGYGDETEFSIIKELIRINSINEILEILRN